MLHFKALILALVVSTLTLNFSPSEKLWAQPLELELGDFVGPEAGAVIYDFDTNYVSCNYLQIHLARRMVWQPIYKDLGYTQAEIDLYAKALELATQGICADRPNSPEVEQAVRLILDFRERGDHRWEERFGVPRQNAARIRQLAILKEIEQFQRHCFSTSQEASHLIFERFPQTPERGLGLPVQSTSKALGQCGGMGGIGGGGHFGGINFPSNRFDFNQVKSCILDWASKYDECTSPVADIAEDVAAATQMAEAEVEKMGWQNCGSDCEMRFGVGCQNNRCVSIWEVRDGGHYQKLKTVRNYDPVAMEPGTDLYGYEFIDRGPGRRPIRVIYGVQETMDSVLEEAKRPIDTVLDEVRYLLNSLGDLIEGAERTGIPGALEGLPRRGQNVRRRGGNMCVAFNPGEASPVGLRHPSEGVEGSGSEPGPFLNGVDVLNYCMCQEGGRLGQEMANAMGYSCASNSEWIERMLCLADPRGPTDAVRKECWKHLMGDNGEGGTEYFQQACEAVIQCPEEVEVSRIVEEDGQPIWHCSCGSGSGEVVDSGGGTPSLPQCAAVKCEDFHAGGAGSFGNFSTCCPTSISGHVLGPVLRNPADSSAVRELIIEGEPTPVPIVVPPIVQPD